MEALVAKVRANMVDSLPSFDVAVVRQQLLSHFDTFEGDPRDGKVVPSQVEDIQCPDCIAIFFSE